MGVAVLHPQDTLRNNSSNNYQPLISHFPDMKLPNPNPKSRRTSRNRKKRSDPGPQDVPDPARPMRPQLVNKPVVPKRGQQLMETAPDRQPQTLPLTEKMEGLYAGNSISVMSPSPSSVPLPAFITKKIAVVSDATSDLRKMLRLDFQ